jgi:hypothetical protein
MKPLSLSCISLFRKLIKVSKIYFELDVAHPLLVDISQLDGSITLPTPLVGTSPTPADVETAANKKFKRVRLMLDPRTELTREELEVWRHPKPLSSEADPRGSGHVQTILRVNLNYDREWR